MDGHPQIEAFRHAAELMRSERYWQSSGDEEAGFLSALSDVVSEVSYQLDSIQAMDIDGLAAYVCAARLKPWAGKVNAELVLMTAMDSVIQRCLATTTSARNTEGQ